MIDRLMTSQHTTTTIGFAAATLGVCSVIFFFVGMANVLAWLAEVL